MGPLPANGAADLTTQAGKDVFYGTIRSFFCNVKPKHWACVNGRPVVVLYAAGFAAGYDQSAFDDVNARFAAEFGGITPYIIREQSWNVNTDSVYRWGSAAERALYRWDRRAGPGLQRCGRPEPLHPHPPARGRELLSLELAPGAQIAGEDRPPGNVERDARRDGHLHSTEYGRQYIDLTAQLRRLLQGGDGARRDRRPAIPDPVLRPPNMQDGQEYADARSVQISAADGRMLSAGIDARNGGDGSITVVETAGDTFLSTDAGYALRYGYFALKDPFYYDQRRRTRVTLVYLDRGTATIQLQYDSYDASGGIQGAYTNTPPFTLTDTGTLQTAAIVLENARFANRQNSGADFRYSVSNGPLYIRSLEVEVLDLPPPVLQVASMYPPPGGSVAAPPGQIVVNFTTDVSPASVTSKTFQLLSPGANGVFGDSDDLIITPTSATSRRTAGQIEPGRANTPHRHVSGHAGRPGDLAHSGKLRPSSGWQIQGRPAFRRWHRWGRFRRPVHHLRPGGLRPRRRRGPVGFRPSAGVPDRHRYRHQRPRLPVGRPGCEQLGGRRGREAVPAVFQRAQSPAEDAVRV